MLPTNLPSMKICDHGRLLMRSKAGMPFAGLDSRRSARGAAEVLLFVSGGFASARCGV